MTAYVLPQAINNVPDGSMSVMVVSMFNSRFNTGKGALETFIAYAIAHELGHALSLPHIQGFTPTATTSTVTSPTAAMSMNITVASTAGMAVGEALLFATSHTSAFISAINGNNITLTDAIKTTLHETVTVGVGNYNQYAPAAGAAADIMSYDILMTPPPASFGFLDTISANKYGSLSALMLGLNQTVTPSLIMKAVSYYQLSYSTQGSLSDDLEDVTPETDLDTGPPITGQLLSISDAVTGNPTTSADFGTQSVGAMTTENFVINNVGSDPVTITNATMAGSSDFALVLPQGFAGQLAAGASLQFGIQYTPQLGLAHGTVTVTTDAAPLTLTVTGQGTVAGPAAQVDETNNNLGGAIIGQSVTNANAIVINNDGSSPLTISGVSFVYGGTSFAVNGLPADLATTRSRSRPTARIPLSVTYTASTQGLERALIQLSTNDPNNATIQVGVVGTGVYSNSVGYWGNDYVAIAFPTLGDNATLRLISDSAGYFNIFLPASPAIRSTCSTPSLI